MTDQNLFPSYVEVGVALQRIKSPNDPAEVHGMLCGMLLAVQGGDAWLAQIRSESPGDGLFTQQSSETLLALFRATAEQLDDEGLGFCLLLPDDDESLAVRTVALAHWVQGFLFGLGQNRPDEYTKLSPESQEFLLDLGRLAQVDADTGENDEENEAAFAEIVEYLRVGVLLLDQELRMRSAPVPKSQH